MRTLKIYCLLALFTAAPILSVLIASGVAAACGSKLDEAGDHPCLIYGVDIGGFLNFMFVAGWFAIVTIPAGLMAILVFTVVLLVRRKPHAA